MKKKNIFRYKISNLASDKSRSESQLYEYLLCTKEYNIIFKYKLNLENIMLSETSQHRKINMADLTSMETLKKLNSQKQTLK